VIILVLVWCKSIHFWQIYARKMIFTFFVPDLDLWSSVLKFALLVTLVQCYVSTKLQVSVALLFWGNRRHGMNGQKDRMQHSMQFLREGCIIVYWMHADSGVSDTQTFWHTEMLSGICPLQPQSANRLVEFDQWLMLTVLRQLHHEVLNG